MPIPIIKPLIILGEEVKTMLDQKLNLVVIKQESDNSYAAGFYTPLRKESIVSAEGQTPEEALANLNVEIIRRNS